MDRCHGIKEHASLLSPTRPSCSRLCGTQVTYPAHSLFGPRPGEQSTISYADGQDEISIWENLRCLPQPMVPSWNWCVGDQPGLLGAEAFRVRCYIPSLLEHDFLYSFCTGYFNRDDADYRTVDRQMVPGSPNRLSGSRNDLGDSGPRFTLFAYLFLTLGLTR